MTRLPNSPRLHPFKNGDDFGSFDLSNRSAANEWENIPLRPAQDACCMFRYLDLGLLRVPLSANFLEGFLGTLRL